MKKLSLTLSVMFINTLIFAQNVNNVKPDEPPPSIFNALTITTALLAIAALLLSIKMYQNLATLMNSSGRRKVDIKILQEEVAEIKSKLIEQLNAQDPNNAGDFMLHLEKRLTALEVGAIINPNLITGKMAGTAGKKYAQHPDMANGFSDDVITGTQDGEHIYELEIDGEKATLTISQDPKVQKFAMNDFQYYLAKGCTATNPPMKGSIIVTTEPGILSKTGYGWAIDKKPVITFK